MPRTSLARTITLASLLAASLASGARADVPECTTTTTTTTTCKGSAAPLAAPAPQEPVAPPPPAPYAPTPQYYPPPQYSPPQFPYGLAPPVMRSHVEEQPRYGMMIGGAAEFSAVYLINLFIAYTGNEGRFAVPLLGPLLMWQNHGPDSSSSDRFLNTMLVWDTLAEATGVVLFIAGAVSRKQVTVFDKVAIAPTALPSGAGFAAMGHF